MPDTSKLCYCDDLIFQKCVHCEQQEEREMEMKVCSRWNWNCTPSECAEEAQELGWSSGRLESAMKTFGYGKEYISQVLFEFTSKE